ncbi:MAG: acyl carrier protein [Alphaproteobacteria bacterium]
MTTLQKIDVLFKEFFNDEKIEVTTNTTAADVNGWDSLAHINLIITIENEFNVKFAIGELHSLQNVGQMVSLIDTKIA